MCLALIPQWLASVAHLPHAIRLCLLMDGVGTDILAVHGAYGGVCHSLVGQEQKIL